MVRCLQVIKDLGDLLEETEDAFILTRTLPLGGVIGVLSAKVAVEVQGIPQESLQEEEEVISEEEQVTHTYVRISDSHVRAMIVNALGPTTMLESAELLTAKTCPCPERIPSRTYGRCDIIYVC